MNVINAGNRYQIYGEDVKTYRYLPAGTYIINFHPMMGFSLQLRDDLTVTEDKIYGNTEKKVAKAMKSYHCSNRNFGVLLSGQKGIGKSLFVRVLAREAMKENIPVITVTESAPGIANFISSIQQDCVVVFDEFEKTFTINDEENQQDTLLSLFDGMDGGHKLFIVTCNDLTHISTYMLNRPGRFHYHFTMSAPTPEEVQEYMEDKLLPEYHDSIHEVVNLANVVDMPYDYLRAITFELNQGYSLKEAMSDLNITRADEMTFDVSILLSNGITYDAWNEEIDLNDKYSHSIRGKHYTKDGAPHGCVVHFHPSDIKIVNKEFIVDTNILLSSWDEYDFEMGTEEERERAAQEWNKNVTVVKIVLKKCPASMVSRYFV